MNEIKIPYELFMCPRCKTKLIFDIQKISCPLCKKEVFQNGRFLDFSQLTPKLNLQFENYFLELYDRAGQVMQDINDTWRIEKLFKIIPKTNPGFICLEIGGADGPLTPKLESLYSNVISLDISKTFLYRIISKTKKTLCIYGDAQFLPIADHSIDIIICSEVLEHVLIPTQLLSEMRRTIKPDGICILSVPNEGNEGILKRRKKYPIIAFDSHINFYNIVSLKKILNETGFDVLDYQKIGRKPNLKTFFLFPIIYLTNGTIYSHIICSLKPLTNPNIYWETLEKNIGSG